MAENGETNGSSLHHQGEFLHKYCTFVSLHDSDNEGVVRIFVALSCELWGYLVTLITLRATVFSPNRSVRLDYAAQFSPY